MKYCKQSLFSLISSVTIIAMYFFLGIIKVLNQNTPQILCNAIIIFLVLALNFLFGYLLGSTFQKKGFLVQSFILLIIAVVTILFDNTFLYYIGLVFNPIYVYGQNIVWQFNAVLSEAMYVKSIISILSSVLPCVFMFLGTKISRK